MKQELFRVKEPKKYDFILLSVIIIMAVVSLLAIYCAAELIVNEIPSKVLFKQFVWYGVGFITMAIIMYLGNDSIQQFAKLGYWIMMVLLIYLLVNKFVVNQFFGMGVNLPLVSVINGATSWFVLPGGLGSLQPSEFMKVILIIISAGIIDRHNSNKVIDSYESDITLFIEILKWVIPPVVLIFLQPDTGICLIIFASIAVMVMCSGIKRTWIVAFFGVVIVGLGVFLYLYINHYSFVSSFFGSSSMYKLDRIKGWLDPESDIQRTGNQLYMALLALGSAGFSGHALMGEGLQIAIVNIPEAQTDFIFAVIGQTFGLIGTLSVVGLCLALDLRLLRIASLTKKAFEKYYICGVLGMLLFQQIQNTGMIVGLLPITGITLPLISYGGSSLLSYFMALGIVMNASAKAKKLSDYVYD